MTLTDRAPLATEVDHKSPFKNKPPIGTLHVTKVVAYHSHRGNPAYKLVGIGAMSQSEIDVDPNLDPEIYRDILALAPDVAKLSDVSYKTKVLELNPTWNVKYKWTTRAANSGIRQMMIALKITPCELTVLDLPPWCEDGSDAMLRKLHAETNTGPAFVDETLGLPRSTWPDYITCVEKINAAIVQPPKRKPALDQNQIKPQEDNVTLEDELTGVADEQAAQNTPVGITETMIDEHELDPKQIRFAIPAHLDKTYGKNKGGLHVRHIFGAKGFDTWYSEHDSDSRLAWRLTLQYELKNPPLSSLQEDEAKKIDEKAPILNETQPSAPTEPVKQEQPTQSTPPIESDAIDGEVVDAPSRAMALVPNTGLATLPMVAQWDVMKQQANVLLKSGFLPQSIKTEAQVITIMMMGSALQIDPIVALNNINVIQGKPTVAPQLMLALVRRSGQLESFKVSDDGECCTVEIKRKGEPTHIEKFSQRDAVSMGLAGKDNWRKQSPVMRKWRAIAAACRTVFSDIIWGIASYTAEEIDPDIQVDYAA